jgi:hypothetical protein
MIVYHGLRDMLVGYVRQVATIRLYTNDLTPSRETVAADFVEPAPALGYAPLSVDGSAWRIEPLGRRWRATSPELLWRFTGANRERRTDVHGWFAAAADGHVIFSERFDDPFEALREADELGITLVIDA